MGKPCAQGAGTATSYKSRNILQEMIGLSDGQSCLLLARGRFAHLPYAPISRATNPARSS
jgi:hypothetical protein